MVAWILAVLGLFIVQTLMPATIRYLLAGAGTAQRLRVALGSRDDQPPLSPLGGRAQRALDNMHEALPVFLALAILHVIQQTADPLANQGAALFLLARVLYVPAYLSAIPGVRSTEQEGIPRPADRPDRHALAGAIGVRRTLRILEAGVRLALGVHVILYRVGAAVKFGGLVAPREEHEEESQRRPLIQWKDHAPTIRERFSPARRDRILNGPGRAYGSEARCTNKSTAE